MTDARIEEFYTVVGVGRDGMFAATNLGYSWKSKRIHSLQTHKAARSQCTQLANRERREGFSYRILKTTLWSNGHVSTEWMSK